MAPWLAPWLALWCPSFSFFLFDDNAHSFLPFLFFTSSSPLLHFFFFTSSQLFRRIQKAPLTFPLHVSRRAQSLIKGLLTRDPNHRLGSSASKSNGSKRGGGGGGGGGATKDTEGVLALKTHQFFKSVDWHLLAVRKLSPPFAPKSRQSDAVDTANFAPEFTRLPLYVTLIHFLHNLFMY